MDGVILFVSGKTHGQVEDALYPYGLQNDNVCNGVRTFFFRRYHDWLSEMESGEEAELLRRLGGPVTAAFLVESRRGENARFALEALAGVTGTIDCAVIEDHLGGLWSSEQIAACVSNAEHDIFSLPELANLPLKRTPDGAA